MSVVQNDQGSPATMQGCFLSSGKMNRQGFKGSLRVGSGSFVSC